MSTHDNDEAAARLSSYFWNQVRVGALRAGTALGLQVEWRRPPYNVTGCAAVRATADLVRAAAAERPLGLVVTPADTVQCGAVIVPAMRAASDAGVAVVGISMAGRAAIEQGGALHFVGMNGEEAGARACMRLKAAGAKSLLFVDLKGGHNPQVIERLAGCERAMGGSSVSVLNIEPGPIEKQVAVLATRLRASPSLGGVVLGGGWAEGLSVVMQGVAAAGRRPGPDLRIAVMRMGPVGTAAALASGEVTVAGASGLHNQLPMRQSCLVWLCALLAYYATCPNLRRPQRMGERVCCLQRQDAVDTPHPHFVLPNPLHTALPWYAHAVRNDGFAEGYLPVVLLFARNQSHRAISTRYIHPRSELFEGKQGASEFCASLALPTCGTCGAVAAANTSSAATTSTASASPSGLLLTAAQVCAWSSSPADEVPSSCPKCLPRPTGELLYAIAPAIASPSQVNDASTFWNQVRGGALQAASLLGLRVSWAQMVTQDPCAAIEAAAAAVRAAAALPPGDPRRPLGIVATPASAPECGVRDTLLQALHDARRAGLPVVGINQNPAAALSTGAVQTYVGENGTLSGVDVCGQLKRAGVREVLTLDGEARSNPGVTSRIKGCESVLGLRTHYLSVPAAQRNTSAIAALIAAALRAQPGINAVFDAGGGGRSDVLTAIFEAARAAGKAPGLGNKGAANLWVAVFDWHHVGLREALAAGRVAIVVDQRSNSQGLLPAALLYGGMNALGLDSSPLWTGPWMSSYLSSDKSLDMDLECTSFALPYCGACEPR